MEEVDKKFQKAYEISSTINLKLPPDVMLRLYAYYKQATKTESHRKLHEGFDIIDAFKLNALLQSSNISEEEAKKKYIELVEQITNQKIK